MNVLEKKILHQAIDEGQVVMFNAYSDLLEEAPQNGYRCHSQGNTYYLIVLKKEEGNYAKKLVYNSLASMRKDFLRQIRK